MRNPVSVVDTNVPVVANGDSHASLACQRNCVRKLEEIMRKGRLVIDDRWLIIHEYKDNLRSQGQPGVGDAFLRWVLTNRCNPNVCEMTPITPGSCVDSSFIEFPDDPLLKKFDVDDRKFVAVAVAHKEHPPILQAADSKWWGWKDALKRNHIEVLFLCEDELKSTYRKKLRRKSVRKRS